MAVAGSTTYAFNRAICGLCNNAYPIFFSMTQKFTYENFNKNSDASTPPKVLHNG